MQDDNPPAIDSRRGFMMLGPNMAWAMLGTVFNQGSTLASNIWIANLLGRTAFGEFVIVLATVQATAALASLGIGYTATRYLAELRHRDIVRAGQLLGLFSKMSWLAAVVAALSLAAASSGIAGSALLAPALGSSLLLAAASTVFTIRSGFLTGALSGLEAFRPVGIAGVLSGTMYFGLTVGGASMGGVPGAAVGLCASAVVQCALLSVALARERKLQRLTRESARFSEERPLMFRFALPAALSGLSTVPALWAVQALLARSPDGFANLAVYAAGSNLLSMVLFAPTVLNGVAMAWINRTQAVQGHVAYRSALRANVGVTLVTVITALIGMAIIGPTLLGLYGRDFRSGSTALALLLAASVPEALTIALNQSLQTSERMWEAFLGINIPRDTVIIVTAVLLVPRFGATGAAAAYLSGRLVALCSMVYLVRHEVSTPRSLPAPS